MINFISLKQRKFPLYEEGKKETDKKDGIKVTIVTEEKSNRIYQKSKWMEHWTIKTSYKLYDSIDFENF